MLKIIMNKVSQDKNLVSVSCYKNTDIHNTTRI